MILKRMTWLAGLLLCCTIGTAADAPPTPAAPIPARPPVRTAPPEASPASTQPLRDPTQIDPALAQALSGQTGPAPVQELVVQITRHGLISMAKKPTIALIEIQGGGSYFVQQGSILTASVSGVKVKITVEILADQIHFSVDAKNVTVLVR